MMKYYIYAYIRSEDSATAKAGTPYYIGKGHGKRAFLYHENIKRPNNKKYIIILENNLTELGALALERRLISWWGRVDIGTGILRNRTDGGDGRQSVEYTNDQRKQMSESRKGMMTARNTLTNETEYVSVQEYNSLDHLEHPNVNTVPVYDNILNIRRLVTCDEFNSDRTRYVHVSKGKITAVNTLTGETVSVSKEEFDASDTYVGPNAGNVGRLNFNAKKINIYNSLDELQFECYGNFKSICNENNLPRGALHRTYLQNSKIQMTNRTGKNTLYIGWYARYA